MTVYILMHDMGYDGATVEGVFATLQEAIEAAKSQAALHGFSFDADRGVWRKRYGLSEIRVDSAELGKLADPSFIKVTL